MIFDSSNFTFMFCCWCSTDLYIVTAIGYTPTIFCDEFDQGQRKAKLVHY